MEIMVKAIYMLGTNWQWFGLAFGVSGLCRIILSLTNIQ